MNSLTSTSWHSYPQIFNVGHRMLDGFFDDPVHVEEKVDGSQFSFGVIDGELRFRSKGATILADAPEGMFLRGVESVRERAHLLTPGWTYRGEYLQKPKHNTLAYSRHPSGHIIIFDVNTGEESYLPYAEKAAEAERIGYECVPLLYEGPITTSEQFMGLLECISCLGGQKIEGVVCKNYNKFGMDKKVLMAKFVSEAFKEIHKGAWRESNPTKSDIVDGLVNGLRTPARWNKAIQHMREAGKITDSPQDIGLLMKEIPADIRKECEADIRDALFGHFWPQIVRGVTRGFPEYYKETLVQSQFAPASGVNEMEDNEI